MKKEAVLLSLVFIILLAVLPLVNASFEVGNYSIETTYGPEENIGGLIEMSFSDESADSKITGSSDFEGEISLIDFLDENLADYSCVPDDCEDTYSASGGVNSKSFSLSYNKEKIYGFVLQGTNIGVTGLSFNVSVNNALSCQNPLEIDLLNDDLIEWKSKKLTDSFVCGENKGCFDSSETLGEVSIGTTPFCEKIKLTPSSKFKLGAWVKNGTTRWYSGLLVMELYDLDGIELVSCDLPKSSSSGGEIFCEVEYENSELEDYYVCIRGEDPTDYIIKTESVEPCGFYAYPGQETEYHDYYIFAKGARFDNIGSFIFNQDEYENQDNSGELKAYVDSYIEDKYNRNCTSRCVIPIRFKSYGNLDIKISNLNLKYSTGAGPSTTPETKIYDTEKVASKISSDFVELDLSYSNITTPEDYGNYDLMLYLGGEELLDEEIEIEVLKVPVIKNVFPRVVSAGVPTKFVADVSSPAGKNISIYKWDFGDDTEEVETTKNKVTHTYDSIGSYTLSLEVEDSAGFSSKKGFTITAKNPKEIVNSTITEYKNRLENLSSQLASLPSWYKINEAIDVELLKEEVKALERDYNSASTAEEYVEIMTSLLELKVPYTIKVSSQGSIPFFVSIEEINPGYFSTLGGGSYDVSERAMQESIAAWSQGSLDLKLNFKYISAYYDEEIENLISVFNLKITSKEQYDELYVVIEETDIKFKEDLRVEEFDDGLATGITLKDVLSREIEFAILEDVTIESLVLYLSPEFSKLVIVEIKPCDFDGRCEPEENENWRNCRADCKPWGYVAILLIILFFIAIIAYILLQFWYKTKYERHLFKNKNDLYNIVNFIKNAKNQGLSDSEIRSKLKQAGWTGEQISYAFKKIRGGEVMPFDFLKLFKKFERKKLEQSVSPGRPLQMRNF